MQTLRNLGKEDFATWAAKQSKALRAKAMDLNAQADRLDTALLLHGIWKETPPEK